jgi:hypothetical protein
VALETVKTRNEILTTGVHKHWAARFCMVAPNICGFSFQNLFHVTLLPPRISSWLLAFGKFVHPCFKIRRLKKSISGIHVFSFYYKIDNNIHLLYKKHDENIFGIHTYAYITEHSKNVHFLHCLSTIKVLSCFSEECYVFIGENINTIKMDTDCIRN